MEYEKKSKHTFRSLFKKSIEAFNLNSGVFLTIGSLFFYPKRLVSEYFSGDESRYTHPISLYLLILGFSYTLPELGLIGSGYDETREFIDIIRAFLNAFVLSALIPRIKYFRLSPTEVFIISIWFETIRQVFNIIRAIYLDLLWHNGEIEVYFSWGFSSFFILFTIPLLYNATKKRLAFVFLFIISWFLIQINSVPLLEATIDPKTKSDSSISSYYASRLPYSVKGSIIRDKRLDPMLPVSYFDDSIRFWSLAKEAVIYWDFDKDGYLDMSFIAMDTTTTLFYIVTTPYSNEPSLIHGFKNLQIDSLTSWKADKSKEQLILKCPDKSQRKLLWNDQRRSLEIE